MISRIRKNILLCNRPNPGNALRIDMCCLPMIASMERNGMGIDRGFMEELHGKITGEMEGLEAKVEKLCGYSINLGSGDQLANLLFVKLELKQQGKERMTKKRTRMAVDSDVLKAMISQHACIKPILDWKEREKLRSTYTYNLISQADEYGRIHPSIIHTGPETGRVACKAPNLQNIPVRSKLGQEIRNAFIPSRGNVIGTVDASQIEMRVQAIMSVCRNMLEKVFWIGEDLYWRTAELMYHREFTQEQRKSEIEPITGLSAKDYYRFNAKTTTLGVSYDIGPDGLVDQFLTSGALAFLTEGDYVYDSDKKLVWDYKRHYPNALAKCTQAIKDFFAGYPELLVMRRVYHRMAHINGYVCDLFGRIRWIPQVRSVHKWIVAEGLRAAGNMPIQGTAAGIVKLWMAVIWDRIEEYWGKRGIKVLMQIHDEILVEGPKQAVQDFLAECGKLLGELIPLEYFNVLLESSFGIGDRWGLVPK